MTTGAVQPAMARRRDRPALVALRLAGVLASLTLTGTLLLLLPGMSARPLSFIDALFTAVSAMTVTGLSTINPFADLTTAGKALLIVLVQIGGIGTMSLVVIIFRLLGRQISILDRLALYNALGKVQTRGVLRLMGYVLAGVLVFEALGALLLYINWRPLFPTASETLAYAVFHAISAFCNAGFELFTGNPRFGAGLPGDTWSMAIFSWLIITGGLGVPVIADLLTYPRDHRLSLHTRLTLAIAAGLIVLGGLGIFSAEMLAPQPVSTVNAVEQAAAANAATTAEQAAAPWTRKLATAFFHSIMARSAGLSVDGGFQSLSPASQFLTLLLMFIGAGPASMGGGVTTGTLAALGLALVTFARSGYEPVVSRRTVTWETVQRAAAVLVAALLVVTSATWLILVSNPGAGLLIALFEVVSAFSTCGLSLAFTSQLNTFGLAVIMLVMFWGRLGALTVVLALARPASPPPVRYPEEHILIG